VVCGSRLLGPGFYGGGGVGVRRVSQVRTGVMGVSGVICSPVETSYCPLGFERRSFLGAWSNVCIPNCGLSSSRSTVGRRSDITSTR